MRQYKIEIKKKSAMFMEAYLHDDSILEILIQQNNSPVGLHRSILDYISETASFMRNNEFEICEVRRI